MIFSKYTNIAFISYKREDEGWAKWLQKKLEHYQLPAEIHKRYPNMEFARHPRHIFKDTTDLSGGVLAKAIKEGLDSSKFLIVVCSPRAAKSEWVCKEVQEFIDSGREEFIVPFIIEGEPYAKEPEYECFPAALKALSGERELLGVNINEDGRDFAFVKVVARLFGLRFDILWDRFKRETKRKRHLFSLLLSFVTLISVVVGYWMYRQNSIILKERERLLINQSRFVSKEALLLKDEGKIILAKRLVSVVSPIQLSNQDRPYTEECEYALRQLSSNSLVLESEIKEDVFAIQYSPNGKQILTCMWSKLQIWDSKTGDCLRVLDVGGDLTSAQFSPDSKSIASASLFPGPVAIKLWDIDSGTCLHVLEGHKARVNILRYSPDGRYIISAALDGTLRIWDSSTGDCLHVLNGHVGSVWDVQFSSKGNVLSASDDGTVRIWDLTSGKCIRVLSANMGGVLIAQYNPEGSQIVAFHGNNTGCLWNENKDKQVKLLKGHKDRVTGVQYSIDAKRLVSASLDGTLRMWDSESGDCLCVMEGHKGSVWNVQYSPNGKHILSASEDGTLRIWDSQTGDCLRILDAHKGAVADACYSPDGKEILSASNIDRALRTWDSKINSFRIKKAITSVQHSHDDSRILLGSVDGTLRIYDATSLKCVQVLKGHEAFIFDAQFSCDDQMIVSSADDNTIRVWKLSTGECVRVVDNSNNNGDVRYVGYSPDGKHIVSTSSNGTLCVWDSIAAECKCKIKGKISLYRFSSSIFSPDSKRIVLPTNENKVCVWSLNSGICLCVLEGHKDFIWNAQFSPNGKRILSTSKDGTLRIWDSETGDCLCILDGAYNEENLDPEVQYSPDGKFIVSVSNDGTMRMWDSNSGECLHVLEDVKSADFSPNGDYLVLSFRNKIVVYKSNSLRKVLTWDGNSSKASFFNNGNNILISNNLEGVITVIEFPQFQELIDSARETLSNYPLSNEQKRLFYIE